MVERTACNRQRWVFTYGFAYRYVKGEQMGMLKDKKALIINAQGKSHLQYAAKGMG